MRFICDREQYDVLDRAAVALSIDLPATQRTIELEDTRLISIAQALGLEKLAPAISNEEAMQRLGVLPAAVDPVSPAPENAEAMPACEICGKLTASKRHKTCSIECQLEKNRRYSREYMRKRSGHADADNVEDAGGGDEAPL